MLDAYVLICENEAAGNFVHPVLGVVVAEVKGHNTRAFYDGVKKCFNDYFSEERYSHIESNDDVNERNTFYALRTEATDCYEFKVHARSGSVFFIKAYRTSVYFGGVE